MGSGDAPAAPMASDLNLIVIRLYQQRQKVVTPNREWGTMYLICTAE